MADRKQYNGLRGPAVQMAFSQQMQALMREMYVRRAALMVSGVQTQAIDADFYRELAQQCQVAALAYFEGLGMIQPKEPEQAAEPTTNEC